MAFTRNKGEMTGDEAFARLSTLCAKGEHSTGEMRQRMMRWGLDADTQQQVVDARTIKGASAYECRCKLMRFALQRGFMPDMVARHAERFFNEADAI